MSRRYEAVLFDVDGTLLDTSEGIVKSVKETIDHFGLPCPPEEDLLKFIGPPIEWSFEGRCGVTGDKLKEVCGFFRDRYSNHNLLLAKPYDGIMDLLEYLKNKNIPIGIATYKKQDYAEKLLLATGFGNYTSHIFGSDYEGKLLKKDIIKLSSILSVSMMPPRFLWSVIPITMRTGQSLRVLRSVASHSASDSANSEAKISMNSSTFSTRITRWR